MRGLYFLALAGVLLSGPAAGSHSNPSSHGPAFFEKLLTGRVLVAEGPEAGGVATAWYINPGGGVHVCMHYDSTYRSGVFGWRIDPSELHRTLVSIYDPGGEPDLRWGRSVFYEGVSGEFLAERRGRTGVWFTRKRGWVQESWPRGLRDRCPDLPLPASLAINGKQTEKLLGPMKAQDPEAPVLRFPGWELAAPGARGAGAWRAVGGGAPMLPREDLANFLEARNGEILEAMGGSRYVPVLGSADGDEFWRLDGGGEIENVYHVRFGAGGKELVLWPEKGGGEFTYRFGEPFPLLPTGERYGAMAMMDWLIGRGAAVRLPFGGVTARLRFSPGGILSALRRGETDVPGTWRWSRGDLVLRIEGIAEGRRYRWRDLAGYVGWREGA